MKGFSSIRIYRPFPMTLAGFLVPMITGLVSATSSSLILYVIFKSDIKLSSTYHRIMALMSCFDIISSIFIALGTIMMPSDNIYHFAGPMLGNKSTCQMQGWLACFGLGGTTATNACLALYFVLKIVFKMKCEIMKRYIEPIMFLYAIIVAVFPPCLYLSRNFLNPNPSDSFCILSPYPESCETSYSWNNCTWIESDLEYYNRTVTFATASISCQFSFIIVGMVFILWFIHKNKYEMRPEFSSSNQMDESFSKEGNIKKVNLVADHDKYREHSEDKLNYTRVLTIQALMYIGAFFLTWSIYVISAVFNTANTYLVAVRTFLFPLQGFWNLLIFLYDKSFLLRQGKAGNISFWKTTNMILTSPSNAPSIVLVDLETVIAEYQQLHHEIDSNDGECYKENMKTTLQQDVNAKPYPLESHEESDAGSLRKIKIVRRRGVEYLGNDNRRYFQNMNGSIRRTGEMEDRREGRVAQFASSSISIESPVGFPGSSLNSAHMSID